MPRRLPPLNALKAFEAAARLLSFARAAEELHLTPSAISHQIKSLEEQVGVPLFHRSGRAVALTDAGARYYPALRQSFDRMHEATEELKQSDSIGALTINVLPTFAIRWLLPQLNDFQTRHPEIEVRISTSVNNIDFNQTEADAAVRFGNGDWPGLEATLLMREEIVPVCSPDLLKTGPGLNSPADLKHYPLLHDFNRPDTWRLWLHAVGETSIEPDKGLKLETTNMAVQGAIQGLGIVPVNPYMVRKELEAGVLIEPFEYHLPVSNGYYLVYPKGRGERPRLKAFATWLTEMAARFDTETVSRI